MTRGKFYLITNHLVYESCEFNGDMYPDGHGRFAVELLSRIEKTQDFYLAMYLFNKLNHNYEDDYALVITEEIKWLEKTADMSKDYFDNWFSDWIFIKNISDKDIVITLKDGEAITVKKGQVMVSTFGRKPDDEELEELGQVAKDVYNVEDEE